MDAGARVCHPARMIGRHLRILGASAGVALAAGVAPSGARAAEHTVETVIENPKDHPPYKMEIEPHGLIGFGRYHRGGSIGAGLRINFVLADPLIKTINNNLAIGTGADAFIGNNLTAMVPVVAQWNLFLLSQFSMYIEPGIGIGFGGGGIWPDLILAVGGRWHFSEKLALSIRIGYPALGIGASFFF